MKIVKRFVKFINSLPPYGCCPNCGTNWLYVGDKNIKSIDYTEGSGMLICKKCLSKPEKLNPDRIYNDLFNCGWEQGDLNLLKETIKKMIPLKELRKQKLEKISKL